MRPVDGVGGEGRHPLDPGVGAVYSDTCGPRRDYWACTDDPQGHCHCDSHDGYYGCQWGTIEFIKRLIACCARAPRHDEHEQE